MYGKTFAIDATTGLIKRELGLAALTATAYVGTQWDQGAAAVTDGICLVNVEAISDSTDEVYTLRIVGSNTTNRSDGQVLAMMQIGKASAITIETVNGAAGQRLEIPFRTQKDETAFRYVDLHLTAAGTSKSITFGAYFSKELF